MADEKELFCTGLFHSPVSLDLQAATHLSTESTLLSVPPRELQRSVIQRHDLTYGRECINHSTLPNTWYITIQQILVELVCICVVCVSMSVLRVKEGG